MMRDVFRRHPQVTAAILFGSRAKGTHTERSDVDLAVMGDVTALEAEAIAGDLEGPEKGDSHLFPLPQPAGRSTSCCRGCVSVARRCGCASTSLTMSVKSFACLL